MENCIFCKIAKNEIPKEFIYESEKVMVFADINPSADVHLLVVPKDHIQTFLDLDKNHLNLISEMINAAQKIVREKRLDQGSYRLVFNGGRAQHMPHLHWHLLAGGLIGLPE